MDAVFKQRALVTAINPYNFMTDDKREMSGVSLEFLLTDNLTQCSEGTSKGIKFVKDSLPYDKQYQFGPVPAMYQLSFAMRPGRGGKPQLKVVDAELVSEVILELKNDNKEKKA